MRNRVRAWIGSALLTLLCGAPFAQAPITDPAPYRRPMTLIVPERVAGMAEPQAYEVVVKIDAKGFVRELVSVTPDSAAYLRNLKEVLKYWRFYPAIDATRCEATESEGRVTIEYEALPGAQSRVFLAYSPLDRLLAKPIPKVIQRGPVPSYPRDAIDNDAMGSVIVLQKIGPDGRVLEAVDLVTDSREPYNRSLLRASRQSAVQAIFEAADTPMRCAIAAYVFSLQ